MQMWRRSDTGARAMARGGFIAAGVGDGALGRAADLPSKNVAAGTSSDLLEKFAVPLLLLGTLWAARYWRFAEFGLYEDDLTFIPRAVQMSFAQLFAFVVDYVVHLYGHARPLSDSLIHVFSNLGWRVGGLQGIYFLGFAVEALNVVLFLTLLRRLRSSAAFALIGGLAYVLFSADTTQTFLTHSLGLQPSLSLLLLAFHAWLSRRRVLAYALAFVILFAYESPYPVFFAAPLLDQPWDRRLPRVLIRHAAVAGLLLLVAAGIKAVAGEERVAGMSAADAVLIPINHMIVGPAVSLATFLLRPVEALRGVNLGVLAAILVATGVFAWALTRNDIGPSSDLADALGWLRSRIPFRMASRPAASSVRPDVAPLSLRLTVAGLAMWVLAYPLTYTTLGYHIRGRPTRVHLAAVVGSSLVVASVGTAVVQAASSRSGRRLRLAGLAGWMGLLVGYGFVLQADYARAWVLQKEFWGRLLPLVQDAGEGTVILVEPAGIEDTYQIAANTWNLPRVLEQLYVFPASWQDPPRVYRLTPNWTETAAGDDSEVVLDETTTVAPPSLYGSFPVHDIILIATEAAGWERRLGPVMLSGSVIELGQGETGSLDAAERGLLFDLMFPDGAASTPGLSPHSLEAAARPNEPSSRGGDHG